MSVSKITYQLQFSMEIPFKVSFCFYFLCINIFDSLVYLLSSEFDKQQYIFLDCSILTAKVNPQTGCSTKKSMLEILFLFTATYSVQSHYSMDCSIKAKLTYSPTPPIRLTIPTAIMSSILSTTHYTSHDRLILLTIFEFMCPVLLLPNFLFP